MRTMITYLIGFVVSTLAYVGTYNYTLEEVGTAEFILQETIGIDDYSDKLVWCELDGVCAIEKRGRVQGVDPVELIGVATKPYPIYRLDKYVSINTGVLMDRELLRHLGMMLGLFACALSWVMVLHVSLNAQAPDKQTA